MGRPREIHIYDKRDAAPERSISINQRRERRRNRKKTEIAKKAISP